MKPKRIFVIACASAITMSMMTAKFKQNNIKNEEIAVRHYSSDITEQQYITQQQVKAYYDIPLSEERQDKVFDVCKKFNVDPVLILAIASVETDYKPITIGDNGNSYGLLQIQPKWWQTYYDEYRCRSWFSVEDNVTVGCAVINHLYSKYQNTRCVLNAYNTGSPYNNNGYSDKVLMEMDTIKTSTYSKETLQ